MTDLPPLSAVPDPSDAGESPDHVDAPDPADVEFVREALGALTFLRPPAGPRPGPALDADPMPDWAWDRLHAALADVAVASVSAGPRRPARAAGRWVGGLAAAGVVVIAIGVAVTVLRPGGADVVATQAAGGAAPKIAAASAFAAEAAPANGAADSAADSAAAPEAALAGPAEPAARVVVASRTAYEPATLRDQVATMVKTAGFPTLRQTQSRAAAAPALPVTDGFTATWQQLRDCITWLTHSDQAQALVVDRGTYSGSEAGVVVAAADVTAGREQATVEGAATPAPTASMRTPLGTFDVWVVDPQCEKVAASLDDFALYAWPS